MLRRLYAEHCETEPPFRRSDPLYKLNSHILGAVKKHLTEGELTHEAAARLLDDWESFEKGCRCLTDDAKSYAERTLDLGNLVMSSER